MTDKAKKTLDELLLSATEESRQIAIRFAGDAKVLGIPESEVKELLVAALAKEVNQEVKEHVREEKREDSRRDERRDGERGEKPSNPIATPPAGTKPSNPAEPKR